MYIDSHMHLDNILQKSRQLSEELLLNEMQAAGISYAVQVAIGADSLKYARELAVKYEQQGIRFTLGIQPSSPAWDPELKQLDEAVTAALQSCPRLLLGIGECGLDYYRMQQEKMLQQNSFCHQIFLAKKYRLPLIVHTRDATEDTLRLLIRQGPVGGIMHCFSGNKKDAARFLDLGFYISFAGNVTYKNSAELQAAAAFVPSGRLLVETDAPYLTPEPVRGRQNRPHYIVHTYRFLAELRREPLEKLKQNVYDNFLRILNRPALYNPEITPG